MRYMTSLSIPQVDDLEAFSDGIRNCGQQFSILQKPAVAGRKNISTEAQPPPP